MTIIFGPSGMGSVKDVEKTLEKYSELGLKACEIAFTYGVYIKESDAERVKSVAEKNGIKLSIHGQYWINLNSSEKEKIEASKKRILDSCRIGEMIGAERVIFHPGYYGKMSWEETYENIKTAIIEILEEIKKKNWKIKISPETMGKVNVFGSVEEISKLVEETGCDFCIDFAHILARDKEVDYDKIKRLFPQNHWHVHFSGIVYGEKGEKHHKKTEIEEWKNMLKEIPKDKTLTIINEAPTPVEDGCEGLRIWDEMKK